MILKLIILYFKLKLLWMNRRFLLSFRMFQLSRFSFLNLTVTFALMFGKAVHKTIQMVLWNGKSQQLKKTIFRNVTKEYAFGQSQLTWSASYSFLDRIFSKTAPTVSFKRRMLIDIWVDTLTLFHISSRKILLKAILGNKMRICKAFF